MIISIHFALKVDICDVDSSACSRGVPQCRDLSCLQLPLKRKLCFASLNTRLQDAVERPEKSPKGCSDDHKFHLFTENRSSGSDPVTPCLVAALPSTPDQGFQKALQAIFVINFVMMQRPFLP